MAVPDGLRVTDDLPLTRVSLLVQIRDGSNKVAWQDFIKLYGPVIYGFARKRGLQDADAADLMQDVLRSVSSAIGRLDYDRTQGTFRGWLFTITRNKVYNFLSARRIRPQGSGDTTTNKLLNEQPDTDDGSHWCREIGNAYRHADCLSNGAGQRRRHRPIQVFEHRFHASLLLVVLKTPLTQLFFNPL